jgi:ABC-type oligopeptide transport system substrate-binding subunit
MDFFVSGYMHDIVGARAYVSGRARNLAGVKAEGNRLVIRLARPSPDLTARLATTDLCAVPPDTPTSEVPADQIPSAGPYYVASYDPEHSLVLRRNPNYGGSRPREFPEIDFEFGAAPKAAVGGCRSRHRRLHDDHRIRDRDPGAGATAASGAVWAP